MYKRQVYVYDGYGISNDEIISVVNEAKNRVRSFWTDVTSDPVIILCDDEKVLSKLGGDHDTSTAVIFPVSYTHLTDAPRAFKLA